MTSGCHNVDLYVLDKGVLCLAHDIFAIDDTQKPGVEQCKYRHAAYRQYVLRQYGQLGEGNRVVIPSCTVWRIRDMFQDPQGHHTGVIPHWLM